MTPSQETIPYGFCHCGCGKETKKAKVNYRRIGLAKGEPFRYVHGHQRRVPAVIEQAMPFKIDGVYCRLIKLTRGLYAIVDAADYEWLSRHKWHAVKYQGRIYACRSVFIPGPKRRLRTIRMHREIMGALPEEEVDHREGVGLDNRRKNLRTATHQQNLANRGKRKDNTSGRKGVFAHQGKWTARITFNGKGIYLGVYTDLDAAANAYIAKAKELFGEFAKH